MNTFNPGDKVKIDIEAYFRNGAAGAEHDEILLEYVYTHPNEIYTIDRLTPDCMYPYVLKHPIIGITSFGYDELILIE